MLRMPTVSSAQLPLPLPLLTPLFGVDLVLAAHVGVLLPWGAGYATRATALSDRFFLGGPTPLRGFQPRG